MAYVNLASKAIKAGEGLFKYFTDDAVEKAVNDANAYKSRELIVEMPIDIFLGLAKRGKDAEKAAGVKGLEKFNSVPYLTVDEAKDGVGRIYQHEGRHRARELLARGEKTMPVRIKSNDIRWDMQHKGEYDFVENFPVKLIGEKGSQFENKAINFPVKQGQSGVLVPQVVDRQTGEMVPKYASLPLVLGSIAATQTQDAEAMPISPVMRAAAEQLSGEGSKIRQVGQKMADDYNKANNTKLSATEYLDKKMPDAAIEMRDYTNAAVKMRGAEDDVAANKILEAVRKKYGVAAPAALMTTSPEAKLMGEPVPETNTQALMTGAKRGFDQTMSNEGWALGLASALGAEGANELRAKLAEQRNPAMGAQDNELMRTIGEILGSMAPGAL